MSAGFGKVNVVRFLDVLSKKLENKRFIASIKKILITKFTDANITKDKLMIIKPMLALTRYNKAYVMKFS